ncbi:acetolactate synthase large subunit [Orbus hercynius]|uniref:Acetolactate synthase n=1 Tax=Orbus hercynius TaxID=593135 RepID=A0A495RD24_9GAMM|nr:acetolactate synthase large subunit [Orbus hercynius]RKS85124.1 acetolactate synthase large subunit [Orbus hercynius]
MQHSNNHSTLQLTGSELIVKILENFGITTVAGIPGGAILPLYDALGKSKKIKHILTRHEQAAGFIAQGITRITGKPAVCMASSGPGVTNLLTAIADAKLDSIPIICITGQVSTATIGTDAFQEVDTYSISIPVTKHNYLVRTIEELPDIMQNAFRIAQSGRPGPVWIDIPKDVQTATIEIDAIPVLIAPNSQPHLDYPLIKQAAALINQAKKPVLYLGGGIVFSNSEQSAVALAEKANIPTTTTLMALGTIPSSHPLSLGMLGMHAKRSTNYILQEADLLIVLGARFDDRAIGKTTEFCPDAKIIHVDIDRAELGKIKQPDIAINGDVQCVLHLLLPLLQVNRRTDWLAEITNLQQQYPCNYHNHDPLTHYGLIQAVANIVDPQTIITTDVGQHQMWVAQAYPFTQPRKLLTSGGLGTMGFGVPTAIGAALIQPGLPVICFTGDGSIMMNIQELATIAEHNLNIKIILLNNQALGLVHQQQTLFYEQHIFSSTFTSHIDFIKIAQGFGLSTCDLNEHSDPQQALCIALNTPGPCLIHVRIDIDAKVYPMVPPGAANIEMIGG